MNRKIIKNSIQCNHCKVTIESKHQHDFVSCHCKKVSLDGGTEYLSRSGSIEDYQELSIIEVDGERKYMSDLIDEQKGK